MDTTLRTPAPPRHDRTIARGALVNVVGLVGKALMPVFFILGTRLYGPATMGLYYLALTMIDVAINFTVSGFDNGVVMFASRYADEPKKKDDLYTVLANGLLISCGISFALILFAHVGGPALLLAKFPQRGLVEAVQLFSWSLPFVVIPKIIIAATKARMTMKWDAIVMGYLRPGLLIALAALGHVLDLGLTGLVWGYLITYGVLTAVMLFVFGTYFSFGALFSAMARFSLFRPLVTFAIPQNLNMTFNTLITSLDVLMLGYFGFSLETVIFYGIGAQVVRNVRQARLAFSESFSPVIARLHAQGATAELSRSFSMVSRWTATVGLPLALAVGLLREDLLLLFHDTFTGDATFMLLLLIPPVLSCCFDLAGNIIVMTGHSKWNLFNSLTVASLNAVLNYLLIPKHGIMGAATATVVAASIITVLQLIEARVLVGAKLSLARVYKPYAAMVLPLAAALSMGTGTPLGEQLWTRLITVGICLGLFIVVLQTLRIAPEDRAAIAPWSGRKSRAPKDMMAP